MSRYAVSLAEVGSGDTATVGGKGAALGELIGAGVRVPQGFAVTTTAFEQAMDVVDHDGRHREKITGLDLDDLDAVHRATAELRDRIARAPVPDSLHDTVLARYRELDPAGSAPVAVRSSATSEDGSDASFAGLQDTYLRIRGEESVLRHMQRCWASLYSAEAVTYRLQRHLPQDRLGMAVVVQQMVDPRCAGVMFTRSPLTGDRSVVAIEASWGLGSALVSGDVTPDRFVVNKVTGDVVQRAVSSKLRLHRYDPDGDGVLEADVPSSLQDVRCLTDEDLDALVAVAKRVEQHYGTPQDIEWAIPNSDPDGAPGDENLFVLQSRPETVWGQREATPIVEPRPQALDYVLERLSRPMRPAR